jgi:HAE1 family hydrophobic/amphiphilic exporter-1
MNTRKLMVLLLLLLCTQLCSSVLHAAEIRLLTLEQALATAMEKNRNIAKAREYGRYVQGRYVEERSAALPHLSLDGSASYSQDDSQKAIYGTTMRQFGRTVDLTLSQPLFTWGKIGAAVRAAEVGLKTADEQLRIYRQAAWRDVSTVFYDVLLSRELHLLARENLAQKKRLLEEAQRKYASGVATDYDVLAAEVAVKNAVPETIRTENAIRTARERLRFLLALDTEEVDVAGSLETAPECIKSYQEAFLTAARKRPELSDLQLRVGIYRELVKIAASGNKPRLDLKGGSGWHWLDVTTPGVTLKDSGAAWTVGVYLTFPFFDGLKSSGMVTQAESDLRTKQIEEMSMLDSISLEVRNACNAVKEAEEIMQALGGTVKQAERLLQMAEKGYEYGVKIRLEVDDAQLNLLQARSSLARSQRDYRVALVNYLWAMGVAGE